MASGFEFFDRQLSVALAGFDEKAMRAQLAAFARKSRDDVIASGAASAEYQTFVNGREGAAEESVELPGPITYVFSNWKLAINSAIEELQRRVPQKTGRYAASFVVLVNQQVVTDFSNIPPQAEVIVINRQPYTRKMETGGNKTGARHFDLSKLAFNRRFPGVFNAQVIYLNVASGLVAGVPWVLKGSHGRRKSRQAGQPITYPALVINAA